MEQVSEHAIENLVENLINIDNHLLELWTNLKDFIIKDKFQIKKLESIEFFSNKLTAKYCLEMIEFPKFSKYFSEIKNIFKHVFPSTSYFSLSDNIKMHLEYLRPNKSVHILKTYLNQIEKLHSDLLQIKDNIFEKEFKRQEIEKMFFSISEKNNHIALAPINSKFYVDFKSECNIELNESLILFSQILNKHYKSCKIQNGASYMSWGCGGKLVQIKAKENINILGFKVTSREKGTSKLSLNYCVGNMNLDIFDVKNKWIKLVPNQEFEMAEKEPTLIFAGNLEMKKGESIVFLVNNQGNDRENEIMSKEKCTRSYFQLKENDFENEFFKLSEVLELSRDKFDFDNTCSYSSFIGEILYSAN